MSAPHARARRPPRHPADRRLRRSASLSANARRPRSRSVPPRPRSSGAPCERSARCLGLTTARADARSCLVAGAFVVGLVAWRGCGDRVPIARRSYAWFERAAPRSRPCRSPTAVLREDAAPTPAGVSLIVDVREIEPCRVPRSRTCRHADRVRTRGGVRLSVIGSLAPGAMGQWRAGRAVRVTATLREPTTYRNPGVPDEQRALARRGIALVGSVKSAAMVEVRGPRVASLAEWASRVQGVGQVGAVGDRRAVEREVGRRRRRDRDRRPHGPGARRRGAAAGGGHVSRHRHLRRQHRDSDACCCSAPADGSARRRASAPPLAIVVLLSYGQDHRPGAVGRSRDCGRGPVPVRAAARAAGSVDQHPRRRGVARPGVVAHGGGRSRFPPVVRRHAGHPRRRSAISRPARASIARPIARRRAGARSPRSCCAARRWRARHAHGRATAAAEIALAPIGAALFGRVTCAGLLLNLAAIPLMTVVQAGSLVDARRVARRPRSRPGVRLRRARLRRAASSTPRGSSISRPGCRASFAPPAWGVVGGLLRAP